MKSSRMPAGVLCTYTPHATGKNANCGRSTRRLPEWPWLSLVLSHGLSERLRSCPRLTVVCGISGVCGSAFYYLSKLSLAWVWGLGTKLWALGWMVQERQSCRVKYPHSKNRNGYLLSYWLLSSPWCNPSFVEAVLSPGSTALMARSLRLATPRLRSMTPDQDFDSIRSLNPALPIWQLSREPNAHHLS